MSIFPLISDVGSNEVETVDNFPLYREVAWDYKYDMPVIENGNFKVVEGNEAIKVWCYKALLVPRFQHSIYSWDYASELMELIGKPYTPELTKAEAKRYIKEALEINPYVLEVEVVNVDFKDSLLSAEVKLTTIYEGEVRLFV